MQVSAVGRVSIGDHGLHRGIAAFEQGEWSMSDVTAETITGDLPRTSEMAPATERVSDREVPQDLITPREVAALFCVNPKTVTRWVVAGHLTAYRTLGGHRRFSRAQIEHLLCVQPKAS